VDANLIQFGLFNTWGFPNSFAGRIILVSAMGVYHSESTFEAALSDFVHPGGQDYDAQNVIQGGKMKKSIHPLERVIRIVAGALISSLAF
jgi:hypothetical protein